MEELRRLSQKIANDPSTIDELNDDQVIQLKSYLDPLGTVISTKKSYANISIINWHEELLKKFYTTAIIGYTHRMLEEYVPPGPTSTHQQDKNTIKKFLQHSFSYDPDRHLRSGRTETTGDPEREHAPKNAPPPTMDTQFFSQLTTAAKNNVESIIKIINNDALPTDDSKALLQKKYVSLRKIHNEMHLLLDPILAAETEGSTSTIPPADIFYNFTRYINNHYDQLRDICTRLYNEKIDIEYGIIYYGSFKSEEEAREYRLQHEKEFKADVLCIENGAVTLLGPFKENMERVDFYSKNTEILKRMSQQVNDDHKLGKDIMEKQAKDKKIKNIMELGPDHPDLAEYAKAVNVVKDLGAKKVLTREEQDKITSAKQTKEDLEVPDNTIQVDMYYPTKNDQGQDILAKTKFFTAAEAPLHMVAGSEYTDKYQPPQLPASNPPN